MLSKSVFIKYVFHLNTISTFKLRKRKRERKRKERERKS